MKNTKYIAVLICAMTILIVAPSIIKAQEFSSFKPEQYDAEKNYGSFNYVQLNYFKGVNFG